MKPQHFVEFGAINNYTGAHLSAKRCLLRSSTNELMPWALAKHVNQFLQRSQ